MRGRIESGRLCTVAPIDPARLAVGDIVLCRVRGNDYLHIVKAIQGNRYQLGTIEVSSTDGWDRIPSLASASVLKTEPKF